MSRDIEKVDKVGLVFSSILKGVPVVGNSLDHLIFGSLQELRLKRVEKTLKEMGEKIEALGSQHLIDDNEDFAKLLEDVIPKIGRSTRENKRVAFRNLLVNAARVSPEHNDWDRIAIVSQLLDQIDYPGMEILSSLTIDISGISGFLFLSIALFRFSGTKEAPSISDEAPSICAICSNHGTQSSHTLRHYDSDPGLIREWSQRLLEMRIIDSRAYSRHYLLSGDRIDNACLTNLGEMLVEWAILDPTEKTREPKPSA